MSLIHAAWSAAPLQPGRFAACRSPLKPMARPLLDPMGAPRRRRGPRINPVQLGWEVERTNRDRFALLAQHSQMSASQLFDVMVETLQVDEDGYPVWLPEKPVRDRQGELPIDSP